MSASFFSSCVVIAAYDHYSRNKEAQAGSESARPASDNPKQASEVPKLGCIARIKEGADGKSEIEILGPPKPQISFEEKIKRLKQRSQEMRYIQYDLHESCERRCQQRQDGQPCEIYQQAKELLNKGNRGTITKGRKEYD